MRVNHIYRINGRPLFKLKQSFIKLKKQTDGQFSTRWLFQWLYPKFRRGFHGYP